MKLYGSHFTARILGTTPQRIRHKDIEARLSPIRLVGGGRAYREDAVAIELDRRIDRALAKKGNAR